MTIADEIRRRGISEVVHFTTNRGLVGILAKQSVMSRRRLPDEEYLKYILFKNAAVRPEESVFFDKSADWLDYVNLSISEINSRFFSVSQRWHRDKKIWWVVASFHPEILLHSGVVFATTNNKYPKCQRTAGSVGFEALFAPIVPRLADWSALRGPRADNLTTCEQAEVLYPGELSTEYLRRIYVAETQDYDCVRGWLREFSLEEVEVRVEPLKFRGVPN